MADIKFADLSYSQPVKLYSGLPIAEAEKTAEKLDKDYWDNRNYADKIEIFAKNLLLQNVDQKYKDEAINTLKNIQTYRDNNNYEYAGNAVKDVVKDISTNQGLNIALLNQKTIEEKEKAANDIRVKTGKQALDFSKEYTGALNSDGTPNIYKTDVQPELDYGTKAQSVVQAILADAVANKDITQSDALKIITTGNWEGISKTKIAKLKQDLYDVYIQTDEGKQQYRKLTELDYNKDPNKNNYTSDYYAKEKINDLLQSAGNLRVFDKSENNSVTDINQNSNTNNNYNGVFNNYQLPDVSNLNQTANTDIQESIKNNSLLQNIDNKNYVILNGKYRKNLNVGWTKLSDSKFKQTHGDLSYDDQEQLNKIKKAFVDNNIKTALFANKNLTNEDIKSIKDKWENVSDEVIVNMYKEALVNSSKYSPKYIKLNNIDLDKLSNEFINGNEFVNSNISVQGYPNITTFEQLSPHLGFSSNSDGIKAFKQNMKITGIMPVAQTGNGSYTFTITAPTGKIINGTTTPANNQLSNKFNWLKLALQNENEGKVGDKTVTDNNGKQYISSTQLVYNNNINPVTNKAIGWSFKTSLIPKKYKDGKIVTDAYGQEEYEQEKSFEDAAREEVFKAQFNTNLSKYLLK